MDTYISMVQGDAAPNRIFSFTREDGTVPDLTGVTGVDFKIIRPDTGAQTNPGQTSCVVQSPATAGQAKYTWKPTDLPVAGVYRCLLYITYSTGILETAIVYVTVESNSN